MVNKKICIIINKGSGELEFEEFCTLAARFLVEEDTEAMQQELREAFRLYDKEGNGYITTDVFRDILHELDDKLSPEELDLMIEEIDADGSGTLDFDGNFQSRSFVCFLIYFFSLKKKIIYLQNSWKWWLAATTKTFIATLPTTIWYNERRNKSSDWKARAPVSSESFTAPCDKKKIE